MKLRKLSTVLAAVSISALALAGCTASTETTAPTTSAPEPGETTSEQAEVSYAGKELVVTSFGGDWEKALIAAVVIPFEAATGAKVKLVTAYSADALAQITAAKDNPQFDVVHFSGGQEITAAAEGLLEPITAADLSNYSDLAEVAVQEMVNGAGPVIQVTPVGLVYRTDKIDTAPTSWTDIFKDEYKGKVALTDFSNTYGVLSMLRVNDALGGNINDASLGLEAIGNLAASNDAVVIATSAELQAAFVNRDIWIAPYAQDYAATLIAAGIPVAFAAPTEGMTASFITASVVAGRENTDLAKLFIDYTLRAEAQATFATLMRYAPVNTATVIPENIASSVLSTEQVSNILRYDAGVIAANRPAWTDEWNSRIAR